MNPHGGISEVADQLGWFGDVLGPFGAILILIPFALIVVGPALVVGYLLLDILRRDRS